MRLRGLPLAHSPERTRQLVVGLGGIRIQLKAALQRLLRPRVVLFFVERRTPAQISLRVPRLDLGRLLKCPLRFAPALQLHISQPQQHVALRVPGISLHRFLEFLDAGGRILLAEQQVLCPVKRRLGGWFRMTHTGRIGRVRRRRGRGLIGSVRSSLRQNQTGSHSQQKKQEKRTHKSWLYCTADEATSRPTIVATVPCPSTPAGWPSGDCLRRDNNPPERCTEARCSCGRSSRSPGTRWREARRRSGPCS